MNSVYTDSVCNIIKRASFLCRTTGCHAMILFPNRQQMFAYIREEGLPEKEIARNGCYRVVDDKCIIFASLENDTDRLRYHGVSVGFIGIAKGVSVENAVFMSCRLRQAPREIMVEL